MQSHVNRLFLSMILSGVLFAADPARAELPPNCADDSIGSNWDTPVGLAFAPDGRLFVWEKAGRVWIVENGQKADTPLIDIREEVGNYWDYGLLGFCLHPNFYENGYIYLLYVVDYHHARYYGTQQYNPNSNQYFHDTIGRLTRYTCNAADGFRTVDYSSRKVLLGDSFGDGFPILHLSHGTGTVAFGEDGTLLAGCGDGASYNWDIGGPVEGSTYTGLQDGIIEEKEDVGTYRCQLVDSLSGKILRLDPETGDGVPSNPFFDPDHPRAKRSRVWVMGLRNPYRYSVRPGSGDPDPANGKPGVLYIGDVGWLTWEDLNVAKTGGQNFGWPIFEGLERSEYSNYPVRNEDAPNPLFGEFGCNDEFFAFRDLTIQDTLKPSFPNPCDPEQQIPDDLHKFVHTRPAIDWRHGVSGPSRTGIYVGDDAGVALLGAEDSPVKGPQFGGNSSTGGIWYTGKNLPTEFQNTYLHADWANGWIRSFIFNDDNDPVEVQNFGHGLGYLLAIAMNPIDDSLYYVRFRRDNYVGEVRRIMRVDNLPPVAVADAAPPYGPSPLSVEFDGSASTDPEGTELTYEWRFSDGQPPSRAAKPVRVFPVEDITAAGAFHAFIFTLNPPHPLGGGNWDPEVMRDGDYPPLDNDDPKRQYDTFHNNQQVYRDYIGYTFSESREFLSVIFQEGMQFADGGWWDSVRVEVRKDGRWQAVKNARVNPTYPRNNGVAYEMFEFRFDPVVGDGIRLYGNPGGQNNFISVGELRVLARPQAPSGNPARVDVTLVVTDALRATGETAIPIWIDNTPPTIAIIAPVDGALYTIDAPTEIELAADISDAEHEPRQLTCEWQTFLHHDDHVHLADTADSCAATTKIEPVGCDGDVYYYELHLTVTDPLGLSSSAAVDLYVDPGCVLGDANCDGGVDFADIDGFVLALISREAYQAEHPHCPYLNSDANCDAVVDFDDIDALVDCVINNGCGECP